MKTIEMQPQDGGKASPAPQEQQGSVAIDVEPVPDPSYLKRLSQIAVGYFPLGYTTFGGPQAHIAVLQDSFVTKRDWLDLDMFMELFALAAELSRRRCGVGQFLPGPASTQLATAIGAVRGGYFGGLLAYLMFQMPGYIVMTIAGLISGTYLTTEALDATWIRALLVDVRYVIMGLTAAAVAQVAIACYNLGVKQCGTKLRKLICIIAAAFAIYGNSVPWSYPIILVVAGLVTIANERYRRRKEAQAAATAAAAGAAPPAPRPASNAQRHKLYFKVGPIAGVLIMLAAVAILILAIIIRRVAADNRGVQIWESFWRVGIIIYGGGQVVLPMLLTEVVVPGWVLEEQYFAGFALVQCLPGPLFNFSAYLGAIAMGVSYKVNVLTGQLVPVSTDIGYGILGSVIAWLGLFGPGVMLIFGVLPFWKRFRNIQIIKDFLIGVNSSSIGLVLAAVFLLWTRGAYTALRNSNNGYMVISFLAFSASMYFKLPPYVVIPVGGFLGYLAQFVAGNDMKLETKVIAYIANQCVTEACKAAQQVV
eukprot:tig00021038_g17531.t1